METKVRLQKYLAERGVASRRRSADLIRQGRVSVAGTIIKEPGFRIPESGTEVRVDGKIVENAIPDITTIVLYKPRGYICSRTSQSTTTPTVYSLIKSIDKQLITAGRLDKHSEGLIILSNDGDFIYRLTHPRYAHVKTYMVVVTGNVTSRTLNTLRSRLVFDGYRIQPAKVRICAQGPQGTTLEFLLTEGRNRQIRKMCARAGLRVHMLKRIAIDNLQLGTLRPAAWRTMTRRELNSFKDSRDVDP